MSYKFVISAVLMASLFVAGCRHAKVQNPIANVDSKQPDKVLYDRAMDAMKSGKYMVARTLLETLINTYPDSEYVARAKLSMGDAWYAEGGAAGLKQAEAEYLDFATFFPNLPEAAEAQLKVANIHYKQIEKADRDFTEAVRAEDAFKDMLRKFPDSKLVPEAKQKLRDVQEVLAERQYGIAHFYYLRNNLAASEARLKSLVDSYPLYSRIDEALMNLGDIYARQAKILREQKLPQAVKEKLVAEYEKEAIGAWSRIVTRYPAMRRAGDARQRLIDMKAPVPEPTPEAIAQSKAEEDSRDDSGGKFHAVRQNFSRHPDLRKAARTGEPSMEDEKMVSAAALVQQLNQELVGAAAEARAEQVKAGQGQTPGANQPPPTSQDSAPAKPPAQVNDVQDPSSTPTATDPQQNNGNQQDSSSKKKEKKGLRKLIPF